ncbi:hypothetical protein EW146_g10214 [Bondarzewia mesenterica]|uniref:Uncharacterized protein n=1 Tax=Bondarzewia mesenterica TaxID=1095465 RepID=A0A4S4KZB4_9AGAM|nr:hypothetical protein EW146_g10214 [Bondarzewia mesenterica]
MPLRSLVHLKIIFPDTGVLLPVPDTPVEVTSELRLKLAQFLDPLKEMPELEVLELKDAVPILPSTSLHLPLVTQIVPLPHLTLLALTGPALHSPHAGGPKSGVSPLKTILASASDYNLESLTSDPWTSDSSERLVDIVQKATSDRAQSAEEIAQLKATVEELCIESSSELGQVVERLTVEKADLEQELHDQTNAVMELRECLEKQAAEAESIRKWAQRDLPVHEALHDAMVTPTRSPSRHDSNALHGEIVGLKLIIQELQKENVTVAQQNKLLESENKLLLFEMDQLRAVMRTLENSIEQSLLREEQALGLNSPSTSDDIAKLKMALKDLKVKHKMDIEQLRKKQVEVEMKSARTIHDLNKEVSKLESLIELKIYREDELEQEVERLKGKPSKSHKKSSTRTVEVIRESTDFEMTMSEDAPYGSHVNVCEICEQPGYNIFTCDVLKGNVAPPSHPQSSTNSLLFFDVFLELFTTSGHRPFNQAHDHMHKFEAEGYHYWHVAKEYLLRLAVADGLISIGELLIGLFAGAGYAYA